MRKEKTNLREPQAMESFAGLSERRVLSALGPVELSSVDHNSSNSGTVASTVKKREGRSAQRKRREVETR